VRPVSAYGEDEAVRQPAVPPDGRHLGRRDGGERAGVDPVRDQRGPRRRRVVPPDLGQARPARRGDRRRPVQHGPGRHLEPELPVPGPGEAHVALDRAVVDGHHQRAWAQHRGEGRVRRVERLRAQASDQPGQFPAPPDLPQRDVGAHQLRVARQLVEREQLLAPGVHQDLQAQAVVAGPHGPGQFQHRSGDPVGAGKPVHSRVDDDRATVMGHVRSAQGGERRALLGRQLCMRH
jgi:hypothetical protein